jgi:hypothetical protein
LMNLPRSLINMITRDKAFETTERDVRMLDLKNRMERRLWRDTETRFLTMLKPNGVGIWHITVTRGIWCGYCFGCPEISVITLFPWFVSRFSRLSSHILALYRSHDHPWLLHSHSNQIVKRANLIQYVTTQKTRTPQGGGAVGKFRKMTLGSIRSLGQKTTTQRCV